jgi:uncharacterized protein YjiS (DUF1127 family)
MSRHSDVPAGVTGTTKLSPVARRLDAVCRTLARRAAQRAELARQRRALARLDDRLLRDVGLTREQVDREISGRR